ncbi:hypothetical protein ACOMHN_064919 [Nucella lapillus]
MNGLSVGGKYTPSTTIKTEPLTSKYTIQGDIGRGKFAVVRKCVDLATGETVAAKVIRKRRKGKSCREEILREVVMLEYAMAHPRLVSLREVFETPSELILVTEFCSGGELFHECVIEESFEEKDVVHLMVQILEGLCFLHENNIVHLDLKPQNILLTEPFPRGSIKICDLGFACLTNTGEDIRDIIGTPDYVAPEVLDYEPLSIQTDMWSLGVLAYVMLTACSPFAGDSQQETFCNITQVKMDFPPDLFSHISPQAQDFITKLLVKDPRHRLTARQCLDHPWLQAASAEMHVTLPLDNKAAALAHDMVPPSNWNPDRRNSIGKSPTLNKPANTHQANTATEGATSTTNSATDDATSTNTATATTVGNDDDGDGGGAQSPRPEQEAGGGGSDGDKDDGGGEMEELSPRPPPLPTTPIPTVPAPSAPSQEVVSRTLEEMGIDVSRLCKGDRHAMDWGTGTGTTTPPTALPANKRQSMEVPMKKAKCAPTSPTTQDMADRPMQGLKGPEERGQSSSWVSNGGGGISVDMKDLTVTPPGNNTNPPPAGARSKSDTAAADVVVPPPQSSQADCLNQPGL